MCGARGLPATPVCVQLDAQDVFTREAICSCTMHTNIHRCLKATALMMQGYVVSATRVTVQCVRYAERRSASVQQPGLSCNLCVISASWQPDSYAFSSLLSVCQRAYSKSRGFGLPRQAPEGPPLTVSHRQREEEQA